MRHRVIAVMKEKAESEAAFAKEIGIKQTTFNGYVRGVRPVGIDTVLGILSKYADISAEWLLFGKGNMHVADNLPAMTGNESEEILDLHAQISKLTAEKNGLLDKVARLEGEKENANRTIQAQEKTIILYERENERLVKQNEKITRENMRLKGEPVEEKRKSV